MRNLTDGGRRRRRPGLRERSKFGRQGGTAGGTDLIRYRRNREMFWREGTSLALWIVIAVMLVQLAATLWRVASVHLVDRPQVLRLSLPLVAVAGIVFCAFRVRANWREVLDIRREQKEVSARLRSLADEPDSTWTNRTS